jgi:hypothetical protein
MPIRSLLVQHDHSRGSSWVNRGRKCPGDAGTDVGWVAVGNDVSHVRHVSGVLAQTVSVATSVRAPEKSCSEHRMRAREAASSSQGSSCCRALSARVLVKVRVVVVDMMDGWMDGWVGDLVATVGQFDVVWGRL